MAIYVIRLGYLQTYSLVKNVVMNGDNSTKNIVETIADMQRRIDEYARFIDWAFLVLSLNKDIETRVFDDERCNSVANMIRTLIAKNKDYENISIR